MDTTIIYLIRHAKSKGNDLNIFGGDFEITDEGKKQVTSLIDTIKDVTPSSVYSSHLVRARQTAEIMAHHWKIPHKISSKIRERHYGDLENKEVLQKHRDVHNKLVEENPELMWDYKITHNAETNRQAFNRFFKGLLAITKKNIGKTTFVVSHGNVIRCLLIYLKTSTFSNLRGNSFENTGFIKLIYNRGTFQVLEVIGMNNTP